jgi:putative thioredoxin
MLQDGGATATAPDVVKETTTQAFVKDVIEESRRQPVLVDFWAPWCGPCRAVSPLVEQAGRDYAGRLKVVKLNVDQAPAISQRFAVRGIPLLVIGRGGAEVGRLVGAVPRAQLQGFIEQHLAPAGEPA